MGKIQSWYSEVPPRLRALVLTVVLAALLVLVGIWTTGIPGGVIVLILVLGILQTTKEAWAPDGAGRSRVALVSILLAFAATGSTKAWSPLLGEMLHASLGPIAAKMPGLALALRSPGPVGLAFFTLIVLALNFMLRDTTVATQHPRPVRKDFPEKDYADSLKDFAEALKSDLDRLNRESNWSHSLFVPIEANVEVRRSGSTTKRLTDLLSAIRTDAVTRAFLVLGDPGSGKSVSLRKLCRDLLDETPRTGRLALYVNLREWLPGRIWSRGDPPTSEELYSFVLANLKSRCDVFGAAFLDRYFRRMFECGRLFVILDSFDEVPAVLDVDEHSWLVDALSTVAWQFLCGAHASRGVLASRIYRRPTANFDARTTLELRPLSERQIEALLRRAVPESPGLAKEIFRERPALVPIARNPFAAALIAAYAREHGLGLPANQSVMYSTYVSKRLDSCKEYMEERGVDAQDVLECAVATARHMFITEGVGLEAGLRDIENGVRLPRIAECLEVLVHARIGRLGPGPSRRFSFVHRRFNEYFAVCHLIREPAEVRMEAIPTDSRWREALVLYCEVAPSDAAIAIAEYCWRTMSMAAVHAAPVSDPAFLRAVHCLRFLGEAFRGRLEAIAGFRDGLGKFVLEAFGRRDVLTRKLCLEVVGLLDSARMEEALIASLKVPSSWLHEVALRSCRHLPRIGTRLEDGIRRYLTRLNEGVLWDIRRDLLFSLRLSNAFERLRVYVHVRLVTIVLSRIALVGSVVFAFSQSPLIGMVLLVLIVGSAYGASVLDAAGIGFESSRLFDFWRVAAVYAPPLSTVWEKRQTQASHGLHGPGGLIEGLHASIRNGIVRDVELRKLTPEWSAGIVVAIACGVMCVPWHRVIYLRPARFLEAIRLMGGVAWRLALGAVVLGGGLWLVDVICRNFSMVVTWIVVVGAGSMACIILAYGARATWKLLFLLRHEYGTLKRFAGEQAFTREGIAKNLSALETPWAQRAYVRVLGQRAAVPTGDWPGGRVRDFWLDPAVATEIAKLDERWLGLDR